MSSIKIGNTNLTSDYRSPFRLNGISNITIDDDQQIATAILAEHDIEKELTENATLVANITEDEVTHTKGLTFHWALKKDGEVITQQSSASDTFDFTDQTLSYGRYEISCYISGIGCSDSPVKKVYYTINTRYIKPDFAQGSSTSFEYNGSVQGPTFTNYSTDMEGITVENLTGTNAGSYTTIFTLGEDRVWEDGSTAPVQKQWTITKKQWGIPTLIIESTSGSVVTFDNTQKNCAIIGFDSAVMEKSGTESATNAGSYPITFSIKQDQINNNEFVSDQTTQTWVINKLYIAVPSVVGAFTYNGSAQQPAVSAFDLNFVAQTGTNIATNAGSYNITFALNDKTNCEWVDLSSTDDQIKTWSIAKATPAAITLSQYEVTLDEDHPTISIDVTRDGDGEITAESSNPLIASVVITGTQIDINSVDSTRGSTQIIISVGEGQNYLAPADASCSVTANFPLQPLTWTYTGTLTQHDYQVSGQDWVLLELTTSGQLSFSRAITGDVCLIGGGGAGGEGVADDLVEPSNNYGGQGGAGGQLTNLTNCNLSTHQILVGAGGVGCTVSKSVDTKEGKIWEHTTLTSYPTSGGDTSISNINNNTIVAKGGNKGNMLPGEGYRGTGGGYSAYNTNVGYTGDGAPKYVFNSSLPAELGFNGAMCAGGGAGGGTYYQDAPYAYREIKGYNGGTNGGDGSTTQGSYNGGTGGADGGGAGAAIGSNGKSGTTYGSGGGGAFTQVDVLNNENKIRQCGGSDNGKASGDGKSGVVFIRFPLNS